MSNNLANQYNVIDTRKSRCLAKTVLLSLGMFQVMLATVAVAQTSPARSDNTVTNFPSGRLNEIKPIRQPGTFFDSNNGSQRFFQRGREQLYFLPDEKSEAILQIDEEIEGKGEDGEQEVEGVEGKK